MDEKKENDRWEEREDEVMAT